MLAQLVASTVVAGELSLMAAQVSGDLVSAHEKLGHILVHSIRIGSLITKQVIICLLTTNP